VVRYIKRYYLCIVNFIVKLKSQIMENKPATLSQVHFRYLNAGETENPFGFVNEFCVQETELCYLRQDILDLLKTAYSYKEEFYAGVSKSFGYNQIQIIKVIEILFVLHCTDLDLKPGNVRSYENNYNCLNREEKNDVRVFLDDFFTFHSLDEWRELMDDLLIYAYKEGDEGLFNYVDEPFKTIGYFEKLAEAIFLVYEIQHFKEGYPKASVDPRADV